MAEQILTKELLHELFDYRAGKLYWKIAKQRVSVGMTAGRLNRVGYEQIGINGKRYSTHRLVFLMFNGYLPKEIDHINRVKNDNRIENLRSVTRSENQRNQALRSSNTSGYKNVMYHKKSKKWQVNLRVNGKVKHFGLFDDIELADLVAQEARNKQYMEIT